MSPATLYDQLINREVKVL